MRSFTWFISVFTYACKRTQHTQTHAHSRARTHACTHMHMHTHMHTLNPYTCPHVYACFVRMTVYTCLLCSRARMFRIRARLHWPVPYVFPLAPTFSVCMLAYARISICMPACAYLHVLYTRPPIMRCSVRTHYTRS